MKALRNRERGEEEKAKKEEKKKWNYPEKNPKGGKCQVKENILGILAFHN